MDAHLEAVPCFGPFTAWCFACGDAQHLHRTEENNKINTIAILDFTIRKEGWRDCRFHPSGTFFFVVGEFPSANGTVQTRRKRNQHFDYPLRVYNRHTLVGMRTGPLTFKFLSLAPRTKSAHTTTANHTIRVFGPRCIRLCHFQTNIHKRSFRDETFHSNLSPETSHCDWLM